LAWRSDSTLNLYNAQRSGIGSRSETRNYTNSYDSNGRLLAEPFAPAQIKPRLWPSEIVPAAIEP